MREIRTYMSYSWPLDPGKIITLPDMDLSYALASTLIEWGHSKQAVSGLAQSWETVGSNTYRLTLKDGLKWSGGDRVTSEDVKLCLEHGMKSHPEDWQSLIHIIDSILSPSQNVIEFKLKTSATLSNLLKKLTEPNFGITKIKNGIPDTTQTTGAFFASKISKDEIQLEANPNYIHHSDKIADRIIIRKIPKGVSPEDVLLKDQWPNLIQLSSVVPATTFARYKEEHFNFWNRPTDRIFYFQMGKRIYTEGGKKLFRFLYNHVNRENLTSDLSGLHLTDQMFPQAYPLFDSSFDKANVVDSQIPEEFSSRPLEIMLSPERVSPILQKNIVDEIARLTGIEPKIISIPMNEQLALYKKGQYDFYAGTVGLADPDAEGLMSFYLENDYKIIPEICEHFLERLNKARKAPTDVARLNGMRSILTDATYKGHLVPFFHLSTMGISRGKIDLSEVPSTDESVTLSKVRFLE